MLPAFNASVLSKYAYQIIIIGAAEIATGKAEVQNVQTMLDGRIVVSLTMPSI